MGNVGGSRAVAEVRPPTSSERENVSGHRDGDRALQGAGWPPRERGQSPCRRRPDRSPRSRARCSVRSLDEPSTSRTATVRTAARNFGPQTSCDHSRVGGAESSRRRRLSNDGLGARDRTSPAVREHSDPVGLGEELRTLQPRAKPALRRISPPRRNRSSSASWSPVPMPPRKRSLALSGACNGMAAGLWSLRHDPPNPPWSAPAYRRSEPC